MHPTQKHFCSPLEVKNEANDRVIICGYASVFDQLDNHNDMIHKGAFQNATASKTKLLWQHDVQQPIGVIEELREDDYGLFIQAAINNQIEQGREAISLIKQGAVDGLSIGFNILEYQPLSKGGRAIELVDLWEVSLVTFPANPSARLAPNMNNQTTGKLLSALDKALALIQKSYNQGGLNDNKSRD